MAFVFLLNVSSVQSSLINVSRFLSSSSPAQSSFSPSQSGCSPPRTSSSSPRPGCSPPRAGCSPPRTGCSPPRADCSPPRITFSPIRTTGSPPSLQTASWSLLRGPRKLGHQRALVQGNNENETELNRLVVLTSIWILRNVDCRQVAQLMVSSYDPVLGKTIWQCAQCHYSSKLRCACGEIYADKNGSSDEENLIIVRLFIIELWARSWLWSLGWC